MSHTRVRRLECAVSCPLGGFTLLACLLLLGPVNSLRAQSLVVDQQSLAFAGQFNGSPITQTLNIASTGGSIPFILSAPSGTTWLRVNGQSIASGSTPSAVTVTVDPAGLDPGIKKANIAVIGGATNLPAIQVTFTVSAISVNPPSVSVGYTANTTNFPAPQSVTLTGAPTDCNAVVSYISGGNWFTLNSTTCKVPGSLIFRFDSAVLQGLAAGNYTGSVTITPVSGTSPPAVVQLSLAVVSNPAVTLNPPALNFNFQTGGTNNLVSQPFTISTTSTQPLNFSITSSADSSWSGVTLSPPSGATGGSTGQAVITVSVSPAGLAPKTYTGKITVFTPGGTPTSKDTPVTLVVSANPLLNVPSSTLNFTEQLGANAPPAQNVTITSTGAALTYNVTKSANTPWLVVPASGTTPGALTVSLSQKDAASLPPGIYTATITVAATTAGSIGQQLGQQIPVVLKVSNDPLITSSVTEVNFPYQIFQGPPLDQSTGAPQKVKIGSSTAVPLNFTASLVPGACGNAWVQLNGAAIPVTGTTDGSLTVSVSAASLSPTTCVGAISIAATNSATGAIAPNSPLIVPVTLYVSSGPLLVLTPATPPVFTAVVGTQFLPPQNINLTSTSTDVLTFDTSVQQNNGAGAWLFVSPPTGTTASGNTLNISVAPGALTPGTYNGSVTVNATAGGAPVGNSGLSIPVTLIVIVGSLGVSSPAVAFEQISGGPAPASQTVTVSSSGQALNYTAVAKGTATNSNGAVTWLSVSPATGNTTTSGPLTIAADGSKLTPGAYTGTVVVTSPGAGNSPTTINVAFKVSPAALGVTNAALAFEQTAGATAASSQAVTVSSNGQALSFTAVASGSAVTSTGTVSWLSVSPASGGTATGGVLTIAVDGSKLAPGTYVGTIVVSSPGAGNSPTVINVTFIIDPASLTLTSTALVFQQTSGASAAAPQTVTVSATGVLNYTAVANSAAVTGNGTSKGTVNWLSVSPASGSTATSGVLTISVNGSQLPPGTYQGTVVVSSPGAGNSLTAINVTFTINQGVLSASATTLSFAQAPGGVAPAGQTIAVNGSPVALGFTVTAATKDGNNWLTVTPTTGTTPANVQVLVNAGALPAGVYNGAVTIGAGPGVSPIVVPVVLTVATPATPVTLTGLPASLAFTYAAGQTVPPAQSVAVSSSVAGTPFTVALQATGPAGWLLVTPTSGTAPANLSVSVDPTALPAGIYNGAITLTSPSAPAVATIQVTLTVGTLAKPVVNAILNAASYTSGGLSPGENVVIFGTAIGPATLVTGAVANNAFATVAGGTRVLFDGVEAPIIYASGTQTSVMVPYGISGRNGTSVVVDVGGVQSTAFTYFTTSAAPGIYTLNQQGSGPGAILNQDGVTVNGLTTPEKRGNVIAIYMTGEGQTDPSGVDGAIIPGVVSALKKPLQSVTASIGGVAAEVVYAGSAPGLISGVMQVNLTIPLSAPVGGAIPVIITIGAAFTQSGANVVTVAVQ